MSIIRLGSHFHSLHCCAVITVKGNEYTAVHVHAAKKFTEGRVFTVGNFKNACKNACSLLLRFECLLFSTIFLHLSRRNRNAPSTTLYANSSGKDSDVISVHGKILSNTVLSRQHMTPEIALHLITPDCAIYHQPVGAGHHNSDNSGADTGFSADPFWGFFWPGGQALTR